MEKSKPVVVGIGELLWDVFPEVKKAGGAPINFVYHAASLPIRSSKVWHGIISLLPKRLST